jgi:hypothetical protein
MTADKLLTEQSMETAIVPGNNLSVFAGVDILLLAPVQSYIDLFTPGAVSDDCPPTLYR